MSQYPSPYSGGPQDYYSQAPYGSGARSKFVLAAVLMYVSGGLMLVCGGMFGLMAGPLINEFKKNGQMPPGVTSEMLKTVIAVFAVGSVLAAFALIVTGVFVHRRSRGAAIVGVVLTSPLVLLSLLQVVGVVRSGDAASLVCAGSMVAAAIVLFGAQLMCLIQALRALVPTGAGPGYGSPAGGYAAAVQPYWPQPYEQQQPPAGQTPGPQYQFPKVPEYPPAPKDPGGRGGA